MQNMNNLPQAPQGQNMAPVANNGAYALSTFNPMDAAEELEGLGGISLDVIKIPAGGAVTFEIPSGDENNPDIAKELEGVVVWHHPVNTYWAREFTGEDAQPDCVSLDGKMGKNMHNNQMIPCAQCAFNQFGSKGAGKACRNSHRLYILRNGDALPMILSLPPSSLKPLKEFIAKRVIARNKRLAQIVTKITLKKAQSAGGITYSQAVFSFVRDLAPEEIAAAEPMSALVKAVGLRYPEQEDQSDLNGQAVPGYNPQPQNYGNPYASAQQMQQQAPQQGRQVIHQYNPQQHQPSPQNAQNMPRYEEAVEVPLDENGNPVF